MISRIAVLVATTLFAARPLAAQGPARYARSMEDTLRFREVSTAQISMTAPQGTVSISSDHDALIAITFRGGDSAEAWYEELAIGVTGPQGQMRPPTEDALHLPFILQFDARGHIETLHAPAFPESFEDVTDLTQQFFDLFLTLPDEPLRMGVEWTDTIIKTSDPGAEETHRSQRVINLRVVGDTTVQGVNALVISAVQQIEMQTAGPVSGQPMRSELVLTGEDRGIFVFDPEGGHLLGRQRTGLLQGPLTLTGAGGGMTMQQEMRYQNTVTAIR